MNRVMSYRHSHHPVNHRRVIKFHLERNMQQMQSHPHHLRIRERMPKIIYQRVARAHHQVTAAVRALQIQTMILNSS